MEYYDTYLLGSENSNSASMRNLNVGFEVTNIYSWTQQHEWFVNWEKLHCILFFENSSIIEGSTMVWKRRRKLQY